MQSRKLLPVARRVTRRLVAAVEAGIRDLHRGDVVAEPHIRPAVPVAHEPVSVLIADFRNTTVNAVIRPYRWSPS